MCRDMKKLRGQLKISLSGFARLLDMNLPVLQSRESELVPWQPGEVARAKRKIAAHLEAGAKVLAALDA